MCYWISVIREKLSFILFLPTKMGFYEFLEMRGVLWWLFGVSVLHKKLDLNRESQNYPVWFRVLGQFFLGIWSWHNGFRCYKDVGEVFWGWNDLKIESFFFIPKTALSWFSSYHSHGRNMNSQTTRHLPWQASVFSLKK
jgi:hypothetical protein